MVAKSESLLTEKKNSEKKTQLMPAGILHQTVLKD